MTTPIHDRCPPLNHGLCSQKEGHPPSCALAATCCVNGRSEREQRLVEALRPARGPDKRPRLQAA